MSFATAIAATIFGAQAIKLTQGEHTVTTTTVHYADLDTGYDTTTVWTEEHSPAGDYETITSDNTEANEGDWILYTKSADKGSDAWENVYVNDGATKTEYWSDSRHGAFGEDWFTYDSEENRVPSHVNPIANGGNHV